MKVEGCIRCAELPLHALECRVAKNKVGLDVTFLDFFLSMILEGLIHCAQLLLNALECSVAKIKFAPKTLFTIFFSL